MGFTDKWCKILLDTTVIVKVINYRKNGKQINEFANKLIEYLSDSDALNSVQKPVNREFLISSISIAELIDSNQSNGSNKTKNIVHALNAKNIEIVDFDEDVANIYNLEFIDKLGVNYQKGFLSKWGEQNSKVNREILTKDLMILGTGIYRGADVILTYDKGMYRIGRECGLNMVYIDSVFFDFNPKYVFEFYTKKCDSEFNV